jgi:hypothetical protein
LFVQQSFPKRKTYKNFFLSQEIIMKTKFFLKAISTVAMVSLIIGTFFSLTPLRVSASPSNSTVDQWPPTPSIKVYLLENWVSAGFWPLDTLLTLTITDGGEPYTALGTTIPDSWGTAGFTFKLGSAFVLQPGQTVTVTDGTTTKVLTVMDLYVDSYNPTEKTIAGHSDPNVIVRVDMWVGSGIYQEVKADGTGSWQVTFDASIDPFSPFTGGTASSLDEDGDITQYQINMGRIGMTHPMQGADNVFYVMCSPARSYTLTIDDPSNGTGVDYEDTQPCTLEDWGTYMNFILTGFDLAAGDQISVASGHELRTLTVAARGAISFDTYYDIIRGVNQPNNYLDVAFGFGGLRTIQADPDGKWSIDYKAPGPNEEPVVDIVPGMRVNVNEYDTDGDTTGYWWEVPHLTFLPILVRAGS